MPINDKQQEFINAYCTNGHNASEAYKKAYPKVKSGWNAHGARLIAKDSIKQAINKYMAKIGEKVERTVAGVDKLYQAALDLSMKNNQPSAAVSAITGIARLYGMDKDVAVTIDQPEDLSQSDLDHARAQVKALRLVKDSPPQPTREAKQA